MIAKTPNAEEQEKNCVVLETVNKHIICIHVGDSLAKFDTALMTAHKRSERTKSLA